jgi:prepilin-type N-terminal cleavage/methylation domain-containing protein
MQRARSGFTLIELLVASGVFLIGFVAVFGLFLAGIRFRKLADDTARASLAASSLIDELRIDAGREGTGTPCDPVDYVGNGFASDGTEPGGPLPGDQRLFLFKPAGVWYRVVTCANFRGNDTGLNADDGTPVRSTAALRFTLFVLPWASAEDETAFTLGDVVKRLRLDPSFTAKQAMDDLKRRGLAFHYEATIIRHPSWQ